MIRIVVDFLFRPHLFIPTHCLSRFDELYPLIQSEKAQLLILDKDDTLTSLHSFTVQDHSISSTIEKLKNKNIGLFVLSNSIKLGDPSEIEGIQILRLGKKKPFNEEQIRQVIGETQLGKVWVVGDRLMTDVYLANKIGCKSALVPPVQQSSIRKHGLIVYLLRRIETMFLASYRPK